MVTVTRTVENVNKSLLEQIAEIEHKFDEASYSAEGIRNTINSLRKKQDDYLHTDAQYLELQDQIHDNEVVLNIIESYESAIKLSRSQFLADQLKRDLDYVTESAIIALADSLIPADIECEYGSQPVTKVEFDAPDEISVEITGDALKVTIDADQFTLTLNRIEDGNAIYSVA